MAVVPTVDARWAALTVARLQRARLAAGGTLRDAGLRQAQLRDRDARIPFHKHAALLELAAEHLADPVLGLRLGITVAPAQAGLFGFVMTTAATLEDALTSLARCLHVQDEGLILAIDVKRKRTALELRIDDPRVAAGGQATALGVGLLVGLVRSVTDPLVGPVEVAFAQPAPPRIGACEKLLGAPARFDQPGTVLLLDTDDLDRPVRGLDVPFGRRVDRHGRAVLGEAPRTPDLSYRVRELIVRNLPVGDARIGAVADELGLTIRTLERRLKADGFVYKRMIDDIRRRLALRYLKQRRLTLRQIAFLLGYAEFDSFIHACRRWTGITPHRHRTAAG
ncbi:MAG: AraC family transcriptional regulator ligand-binding domain-containing protein [Rhodospirillales bacterium]